MGNINIDAMNSANDFTINVNGEIDLNTVEVLEKALNEAFQQKKDVIIDMANVRFIDSTGIGLLVQTYKKLKQMGNKITILNAQENVRKVFRITCLEDTFNMGV
ncbi:MAG: STAS domain-containing protein [Peptostreptococcaceae bacterium]|nr:STAS domain-containing protein [Peptostreptococcaceae bacterium]